MNPQFENLPLPIGRYGYPRFSPVNENMVVYQRFSGDELSGDLYSLNVGIYLATLGTGGMLSASPLVCFKVTYRAGWTHRLLSSSGRDPTFSADGNSVYVNDGYYPELRLVKIDIHSGAQTTLATSKYATSIQITPDESMVAFIEFKQTYVAPFPAGMPWWRECCWDSLLLVSVRLSPCGAVIAPRDAANTAAAMLARRCTLHHLANKGQQVGACVVAGQPAVPARHWKSIKVSLAFSFLDILTVLLLFSSFLQAIGCKNMDLGCVVSYTQQINLGFTASTGTGDLVVCLSNVRYL